jgi:hypothetical protein
MSLILPGLQIASPIGFMAALGLMRVLHEDHGIKPRLAWTGGCAELLGLGRAELGEVLVDHMRGRSTAPEFNFDVVIGTSPAPVKHLREIRPPEFSAAARSFQSDPRALAFLAGFATDAVVNEKGFVARTGFDFSSANQKLAEEFRRLARRLDPDSRVPRGQPGTATLLENGLFGGPYVEQHSFGWDPATLMSHAHEPQAPTHAPTPGQPWLVWLAVESLAWHPVLPISAARAQTAGWAGGRAYHWPEWRPPLTAPEVRMLRARPLETLPSLPGVHACWSSQRTGVGKFGFFQPAARTSSDGQNGGGSRSATVAPKQAVA